MNRIISFILSFFSAKNYTLKNLAFFLLVIMCIQYIPLESRAGVSPIKVATMAIMPLILLTHFRLSKAFGILFVYFIYIIYTSYFLHYNSFRASTIIYMSMFFITYATFYNLVWLEEVFSLEEFTIFIKRFIYVMVGVFLLQQIVQIIGIREFPLINLTKSMENRGILSGYSISYEPSTFARTMGVLYYAYLKSHEYQQGQSITIQQIFNKEHRWVTLAFAWSMFTMGSGTAFICLGILSLYFMRGAYFVLTIPIFVGVFFILSYFEVQQFERATSVAEATMTMDADEVRETDGSASVRIAPMLNTINELDLSTSETWFGHGVDYALKVAMKKHVNKIDLIDDYGLIAYILSLVLVFTCAIDFFSLACIMFFAGVGGGTNNIAYLWGLLMVFTCIKYFHHQLKEDDL